MVMVRDKPIIACFDADFLPYYVCHNKKDQPIKTLEECLDSCDQFIRNILKATNADGYCGFITKGRCFRYDINSSYKSNRRYDDPPEHLFALKAYLEEEYEFKSQQNYEADDLVVSYKNVHPEYNVVIVSPDKDILGSVDVAYNPRKMQWVNNEPEEIEANFWKSMITGDTIDGIKGIPGRGVVAADYILERAKAEVESYHCAVLDQYITDLGEYEGIKEFYKNYLSLKLVNNVTLEDVKLHMINKEVSE